MKTKSIEMHIKQMKKLDRLFWFFLGATVMAFTFTGVIWFMSGYYNQRKLKEVDQDLELLNKKNDQDTTLQIIQTFVQESEYEMPR